MSIPEGDRVVTIQKNSFVTHMSLEMAFGDRFPRRAKVTKIPITAERRAAYQAFKARWKAAEAEWNAVLRLGVGEDWAEYGMSDEDPYIRPLTAQYDVEYLETMDEWRERVQRLVQHHADTGEWLEQPAKNFMDLALESLYRSETGT